MYKLLKADRITYKAIEEHYACWKNYVSSTDSKQCIFAMDKFYNKLFNTVTIKGVI